MVSSPQLHREKWWVVSLVLFAFLIRFPFALVPHFWFDEVYTMGMIHWPFKAILNLTAQDAHPPLYYFWVKCFAAAGRRLGGSFATQAWLRLASILPGLLTCLLGWWVARRGWGARRALLVLAFFAVSPALAYYSIELRSYSCMQLLVLAGLLGLLVTADPKSRYPAGGVLLFSLSMSLALYVHSLAALYLGGMGLIGLAELALRPPERRALGRRIAFGAGALAAGYLPWIPIVLQQRRWFNQQILFWWPKEDWLTLPETFFWYLPFGPICWNLPPFAWGPITLTGLGLVLLCGNALLIWRRARRAAPRVASRFGLVPDRLLAYAAALTTLPLLASFVLTHCGFAKTFLGYRYNLIAAPFFDLLLLGLIFAVKRRAVRAALLAGTLAVSFGCSLFALWTKVNDQQEILRLGLDRAPGLIHPQSRLCWLNPAGLPWLGRSGSFCLGSFEDALAGKAASGPGDVYLLSHGSMVQYTTFLPASSMLLQKVVERRGAPTVIPSYYQGWAGIWRITPKELPAIAAEWQSGMKALEARRNAIPGGQVVLPDDLAFLSGTGWSYLDLNSDLLPERWTQGPRQSLAWRGPEQPGRYRVQVKFWRSHPYPEKEINVRHRLPGAREWSSLRAGLGWVILEGDVQVTKPRQQLTLDLETPTWIPANCLPGSVDRRPLGMTLMAIELTPQSSAQNKNS